jgi:phage baseplate assembly protein W
MSTQGYNNLNINPINTDQRHIGFSPKNYRGFSTVSTAASNSTLYDLALIKQDLINHFHIRKGEKLENPEFGTIIWEMLFEPMTEQAKELIVNDVTRIVNYDPRTNPVNITVTQKEQAIQVEVVLKYVPYNIQETLQFGFDSRNGLL